MNGTKDAVPLAALDKITGHTHAGMMQAQRVLLARDLGEAKRHATDATEELRAALRGLKNAGGRLPGSSPVPSSLSSLALLSTPSSRELLGLLRDAVAVAERVDAERGRVAGKSSPDDCAGTDLAEALHFLVLRVADEVEGAQSGRE